MELENDVSGILAPLDFTWSCRWSTVDKRRMGNIFCNLIAVALEGTIPDLIPIGTGTALRHGLTSIWGGGRGRGRKIAKFTARRCLGFLCFGIKYQNNPFKLIHVCFNFFESHFPPLYSICISNIWPINKNVSPTSSAQTMTNQIQVYLIRVKKWIRKSLYDGVHKPYASREVVCRRLSTQLGN